MRFWFTLSNSGQNKLDLYQTAVQPAESSSYLVQNAVEQRKALGDFVDKDSEDGLGIGR